MPIPVSIAKLLVQGSASAGQPAIKQQPGSRPRTGKRTITIPQDGWTRAFKPPSDISGKITLDAIVGGNFPRNVKYKWTQSSTANGLVRFHSPNKLTTGVEVVKAGVITATFSVLSASGRNLLSKTTTLSAPEFVFVRELPEFKNALTRYGLLQQKPALIDTIKKAAERHLSLANVRLVWKAGHLNQNVPKIKGHQLIPLSLDDTSSSATLLRGHTVPLHSKTGLRHHGESIFGV